MEAASQIPKTRIHLKRIHHQKSNKLRLMQIRPIRMSEAQVAFGPRVPGTKAHQNTLNYLKNKLAQYCDTAEVLSGTLTKRNGQVVPHF